MFINLALIFLRLVASLLVIPSVVLAAETTIPQLSDEVIAKGFPRLMGMNIGQKYYDRQSYQEDLSRLDIVILGFYRGWNSNGASVRDVIRYLKRKNPNLMIGQYTLLSEASGDPNDLAQQDIQFKLNKEKWWLTTASGEKTRWTSEYNAWSTNITEWAKPDFNGQRFPEWLAERDFRTYFKSVPEFDIWYFDNVMTSQRVSMADWDGDGVNDSGLDLAVQQAFRKGQASEWRRARELAPKLMLMGNADNDLAYPEYRGKLQGAFLEGLMGKPWSLETQHGWEAMMAQYHSVFGNLAAPHIVGFNVWGKPGDLRFFRYAFTSCLLGDGYFSFTDEAHGYSSVPWFDEYDFRLGEAQSPPQDAPWRDGVYRRDFEHGIVLLNPGATSVRVSIEAGFRRLDGKQSPVVNNGKPVSDVVIPSHDGLVLARIVRE